MNISCDEGRRNKKYDLEAARIVTDEFQERNKDELCKNSLKKLKNGRDDFDNKAEVVYIGKLISGSFGHPGAYPYQFTVSCVESSRKLKLK